MSKQNTSASRAPMGMVGRGGPGMMGAPIEKPKSGKETVSKLLVYFKEDRKVVILLFFIVAVSVILQILAPALQSKAIDHLTSGAYSLIPRVLIYMVIAYALSSFFTFIQGIIGAKLSQKIVKSMRAELFDKIIDLPVSYLDNHSHGDIMSRMTNDAENISRIVSQSLTSIFSGALTLVGTVAIMLYFSWQLTIVSCSVVIFTILFTSVISKVIRKYSLKRQTLLGSINGIVEEKVSSFKTVTAYNQQETVIENFNTTSDDLTKTGIKAEIISSSMGPVMNMLNNISFVAVAVFGGYLAIRGMITVGVISAFIVYSKQFSRPIMELSQIYGQIQSAIAGAERIFEVLDEDKEYLGGDIRMSDTKGVIEFKNVNFSYVPEKKVIDDFSLTVQSGKKIALVGHTGSGKTTIVNLLMRFYDIDSGEITLDGINIKDIALHDLRDTIGIVPQETVLFTDTLRANISYAKPDATEEEVVSAAEKTGCDKIAKALHEGYETVLVDSGDNLSQGQRQLVTIGRAFLSMPYILILDEATSSIDTRTEVIIQDAMYKLMEGRTSLIIAHRLSTIQNADIIVVMDQGRIVETGNHEELLEKQGKYYELYMTQFAGRET
ncbi:MAG: ABC transporter ATP-binding protein [Firmicutes bacterium]|nr:ABC transporter ATP-binding protein [Bacillota bacterium]